MYLVVMTVVLFLFLCLGGVIRLCLSGYDNIPQAIDITSLLGSGAGEG